MSLPLPLPLPGGGDLSSEFIRDVRRMVIYEYRHGHYPDNMPEAVSNYLADGGLLNALADLEAMLSVREERYARRAEPARRWGLFPRQLLP
ncbi:hypothetical protein M2272_000751 [Mycobacterium frederiksbergense]|uniref:Uncharacterized protein n=1 Tax=Mycolicibacterium frederiksbergense TaxID=117567 RepID=A0ABT6KTT8_9MYCO|nr:hypothetical protein [Mycolicibacterium frederiksbergense]MDH6194130.1 hypothetical protein [Mycolicibacterium frederiksbergense]